MFSILLPWELWHSQYLNHRFFADRLVAEAAADVQPCSVLTIHVL